MDIGVDQGLPRGNLILTYDGRYFFKDKNGRIEIDRFSREFDQYKIRRIDHMENTIQNIQNNSQSKYIQYKISVTNIIININHTIQNIIYDLMNKKFTPNIFVKDNRSFYLGIFLITMGVIFSLIL